MGFNFPSFVKWRIWLSDQFLKVYPKMYESVTTTGSSKGKKEQKWKVKVGFEFVQKIWDSQLNVFIPFEMSA